MVEAIRDGGAEAVLAASIFHRREHSIGDVKRAHAAAGLPVRLPAPARPSEVPA
jgi:cyclase